MNNFHQLCLSIIQLKDANAKCLQIKQLANNFKQGENFDFSAQAVNSIPEPGRPAKPELVSPLAVPKRRTGSREGHAGLIHSLTHIEFNAINLAMDACYRFQGLPREYYANWLEVAAEEAYHFSLLNTHLQSLGFAYGDFVAHNGLWDMAVRTEHDCLVRMALVPRVLEARGIDAIPAVQNKLAQLNDSAGVTILDIIQRDEIKHVSYGNNWFNYLCQERKLDPQITFFQLLHEYNAPKIRGAFNRMGRKQAGFSDQELEQLLALNQEVTHA